MRKESQFNKWKEALRPLVLVEDFHEEYKVLKIVGIGTFAKVNFWTIYSEQFFNF